MTPIKEAILKVLRKQEGVVNYDALLDAVKAKPDLFDQALDDLCKEGYVRHGLHGGFSYMNYGSFPRVREAILKALENQSPTSHDALQSKVQEKTGCNELCFVNTIQDLLGEGIVESTDETYVFVATQKPDHLSDIPEPWQAIIRQINPADLYIIVETLSGSPVHMRKIPPEAPAITLHESSHSTDPLRRTRVTTGKDMRQFLIDLAKAQGLFIHSMYINLEKP